MKKDLEHVFQQRHRIEALVYLVLFTAALAFACSLATIWLVGVGDKDQFAVAIALIQIFVAFAAFVGFWFLRTAAESAAKEAAENTTKKFLKSYMESEEFTNSLDSAIDRHEKNKKKDEQGAKAEPGEIGDDGGSQESERFPKKPEKGES